MPINQFPKQNLVRWHPLSALLLAALMLLTSAALGAEVGDQVQFERAGQVLRGRVIAVRPGGNFLEIEVEAGGQKRKLIVQASSVTTVSNPAPNASRTWTDITGQFKIEAALHSQTAFEVVLRKPSGELVKVPLEKLSVADQEYVAGLESATENPFEAGVMEGRSTGTSPNAASSAGVGSLSAQASPPLVLPAASVFPLVSNSGFQKLSPPSGLQPDPAAVDLSSIGNAAMNLPESETGEEIGRPIVIGGDGTLLAYGARTPRRAEDRYTKIYSIDGRARKTRLVANLKGDSIWLCSADPLSGDVLGVVMKHGDDKASSLCVIGGIRDGNPRILAHWRMFPNDDAKADYVRYRKILGNQVAVVVYGGKVHAFDYGRGQEIWTAPSQSFNEPAITPGGRYAACVGDQQCAILDTKTGEQLGSLPVSLPGALALGFSPNGRRLAIAQGNEMRIIDVATGEEQLAHEANVPLGGLGKPILWLSDNFLLMPSGILLNVERNLIVWKYQIAQDAMEYTDLEHHALLTFADRASTSIVRLPHEAAKQAATRDISNISAVQKGDSISIVANASGPGISSQDLQAWLREAVNASGYSSASNANTQLVASIQRGETKTESYRILGRGFATEEVTFTPYISKLEVKQNGKTLWQQSRQSGLPFMISGDKTLQQAARENERPDAKFFQSIRLPGQILKPEYQNGFGQSLVTARGIAANTRS